MLKKLGKYSTLVLLCALLSSCQSLYYKGSLYIPVKKHELKYNTKYNSIKELDSITYIGIKNIHNPKIKDSILARNQVVVDKINRINAKEDSSTSDKLYTLQEIGYGKFVKSNLKRDIKKNYVGYTKKKVSTLELILYSLGIYLIIGIVTAVVSFVLAIIFLYLLFGGN